MKKVSAKQSAKIEQFKRGAEENQKALTQFFQRPEWMSKFLEADRKLVIEMLTEFQEVSSALSHMLSQETLREIKKGNFKKSDDLHKSGSKEMDKWVAAHHLIMLLSESGGISFSDFMAGRKTPNKNIIPDFSHLSRLN